LSDLIETGAVAGIQLLQNVACALDGGVMRADVEIFVGIDLAGLGGRLTLSLLPIRSTPYWIVTVTLALWKSVLV